MDYMIEAIKEAKKAYKKDEVPVGAIIVDKTTNKIVARAHNLVQKKKNASCHAEIIAINKACKKKKSKYLNDCDIYVSLEPCTMCAGAISLAKLNSLHFSTEDKKGGAIKNGVKFFEQKSCHHKIKIYNGEYKEQSSKLLQDFFKSKR
ncbi:MAG: nucleoside deaminase [Alphaproteobacteria bacterium]|jgi:cytosine deaminase|nr:nucleoside deaminase [Alphaproteobacteria bacterium]MCV6599272.1 nucleoside deaminase [Alphaproteobacteria bacterium]